MFLPCSVALPNWKESKNAARHASDLFEHLFLVTASWNYNDDIEQRHLASAIGSRSAVWVTQTTYISLLRKATQSGGSRGWVATMTLILRRASHDDAYPPELVTFYSVFKKGIELAPAKSSKSFSLDVSAKTVPSDPPFSLWLRCRSYSWPESSLLVHGRTPKKKSSTGTEENKVWSECLWWTLTGGIISPQTHFLCSGTFISHCCITLRLSRHFSLHVFFK